MHCKTTDCYFIVFFRETQLKKETLKSVFWPPEFGQPDQYTGLPNGLKMSLPHNVKVTEGTFRSACKQKL